MKGGNDRLRTGALYWKPSEDREGTGMADNIGPAAHSLRSWPFAGCVFSRGVYEYGVVLGHGLSAVPAAREALREKE